MTALMKEQMSDRFILNYCATNDRLDLEILIRPLFSASSTRTRMILSVASSDSGEIALSNFPKLHSIGRANQNQKSPSWGSRSPNDAHHPSPPPRHGSTPARDGLHTTTSMPIRHLHPLLLLLLPAHILILIITPLILRFRPHHHPHRDPPDEIQPKKIDRLQRGQQAERDVLGNPALVLLRVPVELEGADGAEGGGDAVEDVDVDVVAQVDPHEHEEDEVRGYNGGIDVGEGFGGLDYREGVELACRISVGREEKGGLTARKKSLTSCVMYTASPICMKWKR